MATLSYQAQSGTWSGTFNLNYSAVYDRKNNKTIITFQDCTAVYSSAVGYASTTETTITVGNEAGTKKTVTLNTELKNTDAGGGTKTFIATPNPASVSLNHSAGVGKKTVELSAHTLFTLVPYSGSTIMRIGGNSEKVTITSAELFTMTKSAGVHSSITVNNNTTGEINLNNNTFVAKGDVLKISFATEDGYEISEHTVNGNPFISGNTHIVRGDVSVESSASLKSYKLMIDAQTGSTIMVTRGGTALNSGDTIYHFDVLTIAFGAEIGYNLGEHTVNNKQFISGNTHTVKGAVSVYSTASLKSYKLTINSDAHSNISVKRNGTAFSGDTIYHFDVLSITVTANSGYKIKRAEINGTSLIPNVENSYDVSGNVTIIVASSALGFVYIGNEGETLSPYIIYVGSEDRSRLERYRVYIGTESNGVIPY